MRFNQDFDPEDFGPSPNRLYGECLKCGHTCKAQIDDDSFDHEFGTHVVMGVISECCEAEVELTRDSAADFSMLTNTTRRRYLR